MAALGVSGTGVASAASTRAVNATCSGTLGSPGVVAPGTYGSLTITGVCLMPSSGTVNVLGNLTVAPNAGLDAITEATVNVGGNLLVKSGGILGLGCSPEAGCATTTSDHIYGSLIASRAVAVIAHSNTIGGNVSIQGGGGGFGCAPNEVLSAVAGFPAPPFSTLEDNTIGGNTVITGLQSCWFGFIRNEVQGNVILENNTMADPDANEVVTNFIQRNLICLANSPAPQVGDSFGDPNVVLGHKLGQCANIQ
jgi:hypothetical protein